MMINEFVQPVPSSMLRTPSKRKKEKACEDKSRALVTSKVDDGLDYGNLDLWSEKDEINGKIKKNMASHILAIEVEPPGCSFNPPFEAHQDSLAQAVVVKIQKIYKRKLQPELVSLIVTDEVLDKEVVSNLMP
ncbi:ribosome biogenesis protein NOP53-like [Dioscorea cayenensis subsp. rotundata]|uniref:Ribosome biogenesis protein NOP53 n=1 Tax=Dioscorea cayennensis subsp. rotundata TaxID=55577 RepID=A0AB40AWM5_DIOCR|nr:ribosome biogenesis protein NOP53-like [Dioscorea cayenensis subsp. rotundata]